jgi:16S rRNA (uracil1498-N3)-methyltransferase
MTDHLTEPGGKVRLHVSAALHNEARVTPDEGQAHYLLHVMRVKVGDRVSLFNGRDGEWLARIDTVTKRGCTLVCQTQTENQKEVPDIWLCFAPIKKTPSDYVVQKATELGARTLQPVLTRRTIVTRVNEERMRANAIEAAEQSGRLDLPEIRNAVTLDKLLSGWPQERWLIFCDEAGEAPPIAKALDQKHKQCAVLTGPEGGFDAAEREKIRAQSFVLPVSLGTRILRADTAALAALAVWQSIAGDWRN